MGRIAETAHTRAQEGAMFGSQTFFSGPKKKLQKGVGRASTGIRQPVASPSSNMSLWGLMADPFKPALSVIHTFSMNIWFEIPETHSEKSTLS